MLHKCVTINKSGWKYRCLGLFMGGNVSISRNRTKIERLLDWKEFTSKSVGRFSFQCLTALSVCKITAERIAIYLGYCKIHIFDLLPLGWGQNQRGGVKFAYMLLHVSLALI